MKKNKNNNEKKSFFKMFFTKYTIYGVLIILVSVVVDLYNDNNLFLVNVIKNILSTTGTAILVGAIFDFSKNSEAFTEFVSNILKDIVISKDFLNEMAETEKKIL